MSSVLGVSVGAGALRVARPHPGNSPERFAPDHFDLQTLQVDEQRVEELAADTVGAALSATPDIGATAIAYRSEQHARALRAALARRQLTNYELVPEVVAALEFLESAGELSGYRTIALYDLGSSGLSVSVVDVASRQICYGERTSDISGDYLDSLIREQQIASGRIAHPPDPAGLAALDAVCRQAKEQLSVNTAVALPSEHGLVLISQENFEALIMLAVESSARMTRDVIMRSEQAVQAVIAVGGCAQIPLVTRVLGRWLGMPVVVPAHPESVVARGAALLARPARTVAPPPPQQPPMETADTEQLAPAWLADAPPPRGRRRETAHGRGLELARGRRRELSVAGVAAGALVVVAAVGLGLGWAPQVLQGNSQSSKSSSDSSTTSTPRPAALEPSLSPSPTDTTNASIAAPPPRWNQTTTEAPPPPPGPNTIVVPGLPPIVVPTIPPNVIPQFPIPGP
ncbi:Hsp70 family protein [Nocardia transvalensis]|uniref:Hsp70 family protein n=1 Tax=Nocardia transvalensis TaxID=37333 RepID=UPI001895D0E5|nr:Hsp70 family protein [Nocardia transvalensis]MBF6329016.1 Hsp70 family protein [Nocardia transvalensis]